MGTSVSSQEVHIGPYGGIQFVTKDSGIREDYKSGMRRDTQSDKPRYDLIAPLLLDRLAGLLARGAEKYGERNWELANSEEEANRFKASAFRHFIDWQYNRNTEEDHMAATVFNLMAYEVTKQRIKDANRKGTTSSRG